MFGAGENSEKPFDAPATRDVGPLLEECCKTPYSNRILPIDYRFRIVQAWIFL